MKIGVRNRVWGFLIWISLLFVSASWANDYSIIEKGHRKGLVNNRGKVIIPAEYEDLGWSEGEAEVIADVIGYKENNRWGLIKINNTKLTLPEFNDIFPFDKNHFVATKFDTYKLNTLYGVINLSGKTQIDFKYTSLKKFGNFLVGSRKKDQQIFYGLIDIKDRKVISFEYLSVKYLTTSLIAVKDKNHQFTLIDDSGKIILDQKVDGIDSLSEKYFQISVKGKLGIIDHSGNLIINPAFHRFRANPHNLINALTLTKWKILNGRNDLIGTFEYENIIPLDSNLYKAQTADFSFIIDSNGDELFSIRNSDITVLNDSLASISSGSKYGVIDYSGDTLLSLQYDSLRIVNGRFLLFEKYGIKKGWKITDLSGFQISLGEFDIIQPLNNSFFTVRRNGFWGVVDYYGKELIFPKYDSIYLEINNQFLVDFHGEKGIIDYSGDWKVYPQKGDLYFLSDGNFLISSFFQSKIINRWGKDLFTSENYLKPVLGAFIEEDYEGYSGLLNANYERILPIKYDFITPIIPDSIFLFFNKDGWGTVDLTRGILFEKDNRFQQIIGYNDGLIGVKINGHYGFIDINGKLRIANRYEGINLFNEGLANIRIFKKWGCINVNEKIVVQPYYDHIESFYRGMAIAKKDGKYGILDNAGNTRVDFEYDSIYRIQNEGFICVLNKLSGMINNKGEIEFYPKFDLIKNLGNGYVLAKRKNKYGIFTSNGIIVIPVSYDHMIYNHYNNLFLASDKPKWVNITDNSDAEVY